MAFEVPRQQERYRDTGRRQINVLGRDVPASLVKLKEADASVFKASHEIFLDKIPGASNQQMIGLSLNFDGQPYRVIKVTDPKSNDPAMRGKYLRLICVSEERA